jgi:hypothetical protein
MLAKGGRNSFFTLAIYDMNLEKVRLEKKYRQ